MAWSFYMSIWALIAVLVVISIVFIDKDSDTPWVMHIVIYAGFALLVCFVGFLMVGGT